jgi:hypothetical protein
MFILINVIIYILTIIGLFFIQKNSYTCQYETVNDVINDMNAICWCPIFNTFCLICYIIIYTIIFIGILIIRNKIIKKIIDIKLKK